ncbi:hypothetical protein ACOME3_003452 [Neoechinorhynchus agilis]
MNFSSILIKCLSSPCFATSFPLRFIHHSRTLSSFYQNTAYEIWKCNSSVSNAGARKGRGRRGVVRRKDLNIGQIIGKGRLKLAIPGLTTEIKIDDRSNKITEIGEDEEFDKRLQDSRNRAQAFRKLTVLSTERGWTGGHMGGRSAGKIEQVDNNQSGCSIFSNELCNHLKKTYLVDLESFQTRILYLSQKQIMTKVFGRKRRVRALVACGNGNGVVGLGAAVGNYIAPVLTKAKQRSARNLVHVYRNEDQSVLHDFAQSYGFAEMYVSRRGPGHGLICHRLIKTLCELIGIKNIYAKQIGTTNPVSMANAFLIGLLKQKSYQTIADEQRLLVVKMDPLWQACRRNFIRGELL